MLCKTSCDDGELFKGECAEGSSADTTVCDVCPVGFYCQEGLKKECKTSCPTKTKLEGECIAGSVTDTVQCVGDGTPEPFSILWYRDRTGAEAVGEGLLGDRSDLLGAETRLSCPSCGKGFVMGRHKMPLTGAKWLVHWYAAWPDYDSKASADGQSHTFPVQGYGIEKADSITATMNGVVIEMPPPMDKRGTKIELGKMAHFSHEFEGDELAYRFDFTSQTSEVLARPFIVSGEVTLLRDSTTGDEGSGAGKSTGGAIAGRVLNAIDGKRISTFAKLRGCNSGECLLLVKVFISDPALCLVSCSLQMFAGFDKRGWECTGDPRFLIFKATKLVAQVRRSLCKEYCCLFRSVCYPGSFAAGGGTAPIFGHRCSHGEPALAHPVCAHLMLFYSDRARYNCAGSGRQCQIQHQSCGR